MSNSLSKIILTTGEPAGIGPDLVLAAAADTWGAHLIAIGNRALLIERAQTLGLSVELHPYTSTDALQRHQPGLLPLIDIPLHAACTPGQPDIENASHVLAQLDMAVNLCQSGECAAMVTAPVHKAVINDAGVPFSGHTEYLTAATGAEQSVMLLASGDLRVALATTHLPLRAVPDALDPHRLKQTLDTLHHDLVSRVGCAVPHITVLGLNPHAGEGGHLGSEDQELIAPVCETLRGEGMDILGPVPADSAFIPSLRAQTDAYLAMYHDQGLPVLKALGFQGAVNITLGLPIVRTSVDHGTALDLAATGKADAGSLKAAIQAAIELAL
jgi:4-hydroxythreonine-4-phosphate dehydrogenase